MPSDVIAMVLGGGRGTRLYPLTRDRSKPAVPIGGKYRLIDVPISNCFHSGIFHVYILTQFNSASLNRHVHRTYQLSPFTEGFVEILAAEQTMENADWFQGTADAVRQSLRHIEHARYRDVLILSGDHLYRMDYGEFHRTHLDRDNDVTVSVKPVSHTQAPAFGILRSDAEGTITDFVEKPADPDQLEALRLPGAPNERAFMASMGIYLFRKEVLFELLSGGSEEDFGREIIPRAIREHRVSPHVFDGYWEDIGTIGSFHEANLACVRENPQFAFYAPQKPMYTHPRFLPSSHADRCHIWRSMLSEGSMLRDSTIIESIIGVRSIIREGTRIKRSIVMGADFYEHDWHFSGNRERSVPDVGIGRNCIIENAIIDKNARIGEGSRITNERGVEREANDHYAISDGIVVIPKNAVIPPGTVI